MILLFVANYVSNYTLINMLRIHSSQRFKPSEPKSWLAPSIFGQNLFDSA